MDIGRGERWGEDSMWDSTGARRVVRRGAHARQQAPCLTDRLPLLLRALSTIPSGSHHAYTKVRYAAVVALGKFDQAARLVQNRSHSRNVFFIRMW